MRKAFTLAEILITLGVIGVIAAITLPIIITNYQKHKTVNKLKKVYTVLNQAYKMSEIDNDSFENWSTIDDIGMDEYLNRYWKPYLRVIKQCKNYKDCGYSEEFPWQNANNTANSLCYMTLNGNIILKDGTLLMFRSALNRIFVDLNASTKPNQYGRDYFSFTITAKGIVATGTSPGGTSYYCNKNTTNNSNGEYCAGKIIYDGWKIKSDYPW